MSLIPGDLIKIETFDGLYFYSPDETIQFLTYGDWGAAPTQYQTRRGYKQDGSTEVDFQLEPRTISLQLHRNPACSRQDYWNNRLALHEFLRPNRNGPITFTLRQPDGALRSLIVRADPGLEFPPLPVDENNWDIREQIDFIAFDPIWFDPGAVIYANAASADTQLVFPITFPIIFGLSGTFFTTGSFTYAGTWKSYPTMTLTGPYTRAVITNVTTGISIVLSVAILAGEQRIITLTPGNQSIVDAFGVNKFSDLSPGSNLIDFNIRPDPEVAGGIQEIQAGFVDGTSGSAFTLEFDNRYFAI